MRVSALAGAASIQAAAGAPWFTVSADDRTTPASLTFSLTPAAASLIPATYQAAFSVTANGAANSPLNGLVRWTASAPAVSTGVRNARAAASVVLANGCPAPDPATAFFDTGLIWTWFTARNVQPGDSAYVQWFDPGGSLVATVNPGAPSEAGNYCFAASIDPVKASEARRYGIWRADVYWNGAKQASLPFAVDRPYAVSLAPCEDSLCVSSSAPGVPATVEWTRPDGVADARVALQLGPQSAPLPFLPLQKMAGVWTARVLARGVPLGSTRFTVSSPVQAEASIHPQFVPADASAELSYTLEGLLDGDVVAVRFVAPDGSVRDNDAAALDISNETASGHWRALLLWNGIAVASAPFDILPVRVESAVVARQSAPLCADTPPESTFVALDSAARTAIVIGGAAAGDHATVDYWNGGALRWRVDFDPFASQGDWCLAAALPVSGAIGARNAGLWEARASLNGTELVRLPFEVRAASDAFGFASLDEVAVPSAKGDLVPRP